MIQTNTPVLCSCFQLKLTVTRLLHMYDICTQVKGMLATGMTTYIKPVYNLTTFKHISKQVVFISSKEAKSNEIIIYFKNGQYL